METLKIFTKNLISLIIDLFLLLIIIGIYSFLPYEEISIFGWKSNLYSNVGFLLLFLFFSIIPHYYLNDKTIGNKIMKLEQNQEIKNESKPFYLIELFVNNILNVFKKLFFISSISYIYKRWIKR